MSVEIETIFSSHAQGRSLLLDAFRGIAKRLRRYGVSRATHRALSRLGERELKDIGLFRTEFGGCDLDKEKIRARD